MTPEGKIKNKVRAILREYAPDVWYFMPVSAGYGRHGIPDFVCCVNGWFLGIECKATQSNHLTDLQVITHQQINDADGYTLVVHEDTIEAVRGYICLLLAR